MASTKGSNENSKVVKIITKPLMIRTINGYDSLISLLKQQIVSRYRIPDIENSSKVSYANTVQYSVMRAVPGPRHPGNIRTSVYH